MKPPICAASPPIVRLLQYKPGKKMHNTSGRGKKLLQVYINFSSSAMSTRLAGGTNYSHIYATCIDKIAAWNRQQKKNGRSGT